MMEPPHEPDVGTPPDVGNTKRRNSNLTRRCVEYVIQNRGRPVTLDELCAAVQAPRGNVAASISYIRRRGIPIRRPVSGLYVYDGEPFDVEKVLPGVRGPNLVDLDDQRSAAATPIPSPTPSSAAPVAPTAGAKIDLGEMLEVIGHTVDGSGIARAANGLIFRLVRL